MPSNKAEKGKNDAATLVFPSIYVGPFSAASNSAFLAANSITHVLSIGHTPGPPVPEITYSRVSLTDSSSSSIEKVMREATSFIDAALASKRGAVLVHCAAGISRSPTVVTAYLMSRHGLTLFEALRRIVLARPIVTPNEGFLRQLKELDVRLHGQLSLNVDGELPRRREEREALFRRAEVSISEVAIIGTCIT